MCDSECRLLGARGRRPWSKREEFAFAHCITECSETKGPDVIRAGLFVSRNGLISGRRAAGNSVDPISDFPRKLSRVDGVIMPDSEWPALSRSSNRSRDPR